MRIFLFNFIFLSYFSLQKCLKIISLCLSFKYMIIALLWTDWFSDRSQLHSIEKSPTSTFWSLRSIRPAFVVQIHFTIKHPEWEQSKMPCKWKLPFSSYSPHPSSWSWGSVCTCSGSSWRWGALQWERRASETPSRREKERGPLQCLKRCLSLSLPICVCERAWALQGLRGTGWLLIMFNGCRFCYNWSDLRTFNRVF